MPPKKTVLITGCGPNGIGSALATEFHVRGHRVFATGLEEALLAHLRALGIETLVLDVTSTASVERAAAHVAELTDGTLDILINNAGVMHVMPFADSSVADARRVFDVNVFGTIAVTLAFLPLLRSSAMLRSQKQHDTTTITGNSSSNSSSGGGGGGGGGGRSDALVANIVSINSEIRPPFFGFYNASKAAVEVLGHTIRPELAPLGIRVVAVKTGCVRSDLFANAPAATAPLPDRSWYGAARQWIEGRRMLESARNEEPAVYARGVVNELLRPRPKKVVWQGGLTFFAWVLSWLGWEGMMDGIYIRENRINLCAGNGS